MSELNVSKIIYKISEGIKGHLEPSKIHYYILPALFYKYYSHKQSFELSFWGGKGFDNLEFSDNETLISQYYNDLKIISDNDSSFPSLDNIFTRRSDSLTVKGLGNILNSLRKLEVHELPVIYEEFKLRLSEFSSRQYGSFETPHSLNVLMSKILLKSENGPKNRVSVYDPVCGQGDSLKVFRELSTQEVAIYGQEINHDLVLFAQMNLYMGNKDKSNYSTISWGDTLSNPAFVDGGKVLKFDYVIAQPPFNLVLPISFNSDDPYQRWEIEDVSKNGNNAFLLHILSSLNDQGKAVVTVPSRVLFSQSRVDRKLRERLVESGVIKAVVSLAPRLLHNTSIPIHLLIFDNSKNHNSIRFIDASDKFEKVNLLISQISSSDIDSIVEAVYSDETIVDFAKSVDSSEIREHNFDLLPSRYVADTLAEEDGFKVYKFEDLATYIGRTSKFDVNISSYINPRDLSNNPFNIDVIPSGIISEGSAAKNYYLLQENALLIARVANFRLGIIEASKENPVLVSKNIYAFSWNPEKVDISYLAMELYSDYVLNQINISSRVAHFISRMDLESLKIRLPKFSENNLAVQKAQVDSARLQFDKDKIAENNLQGTIDALIKDRFEEFQWDLHDIRNSELLAITQQAQILTKIMQRNPDAAQTIVDSRKNINLQDYMQILLVNTQALAKKISTIYEFATTQEQFEVFDVVAFVENFMKTQEHLDLGQINYEFITDNIEEIYALGLSIQVKFNKVDLTRILNNIVENVKRHASFDPENPSLNKFSIAIEVPSSSEVKISFLNSGERTEVTPSMYFSRDRKWGKTGNSGMGGYAIKKLANRNSAQVDVETFAEGEYVFGVSILINRVFEYVI